MNSVIGIARSPLVPRRSPRRRWRAAPSSSRPRGRSAPPTRTVRGCAPAQVGSPRRRRSHRAEGEVGGGEVGVADQRADPEVPVGPLDCVWSTRDPWMSTSIAAVARRVFIIGIRLGRRRGSGRRHHRRVSPSPPLRRNGPRPVERGREHVEFSHHADVLNRNIPSERKLSGHRSAQPMVLPRGRRLPSTPSSARAARAKGAKIFPCGSWLCSSTGVTR